MTTGRPGAPSDTSGSDRPAGRGGRDWHAILVKVLWSLATFAVPLCCGLAVHYTLGQWPGWIAFAVAALITGVVARRADPHRRPR